MHHGWKSREGGNSDFEKRPGGGSGGGRGGSGGGARFLPKLCGGRLYIVFYCIFSIFVIPPPRKNFSIKLNSRLGLIRNGLKGHLDVWFGFIFDFGDFRLFLSHLQLERAGEILNLYLLDSKCEYSLSKCLNLIVWHLTHEFCPSICTNLVIMGELQLLRKMAVEGKVKPV